MVKIFVNYKIDKNGKVAIVDYGKVFVDQPFAIAELDKEYAEPFVVTDGKINFIVEKAEYEAAKEKENTLEEYNLIIEPNGTVRNAAENELEKAFKIKLPVETDISSLRFQNGQLIKLDFDEKGGND